MQLGWRRLAVAVGIVAGTVLVGAPPASATILGVVRDGEISDTRKAPWVDPQYRRLYFVLRMTGLFTLSNGNLKEGTFRVEVRTFDPNGVFSAAPQDPIGYGYLPEAFGTLELNGGRTIPFGCSGTAASLAAAYPYTDSPFDVQMRCDSAVGSMWLHAVTRVYGPYVNPDYLETDPSAAFCAMTQYYECQGSYYQFLIGTYSVVP